MLIWWVDPRYHKEGPIARKEGDGQEGVLPRVVGELYDGGKTNVVFTDVFSFFFVGIELISSTPLEIGPVMFYYFVDCLHNLRENV